MKWITAEVIRDCLCPKCEKRHTIAMELIAWCERKDDCGKARAAVGSGLVMALVLFAKLSDMPRAVLFNAITEAWGEIALSDPSDSMDPTPRAKA